MKVFCCQLDIVWEDKRANFEKLENLLANARLPAGSLLLLPEMCFTGFSMNVARIAEREPECTEAFLAATAKRYRLYLVSGLVTRTPDGRGRNEAIFMTPRGIVESRYQKLHLFSPGSEHLFFESGTKAVTFPWQNGLVAPFICYDLRFPEAFRATVDAGAELYVVIANWPRSRERHWLALLQARAIENQAFVAGVNRCGRDPQADYSGRSVIIGPGGEILADAGGLECLIGVDLNWETVREYRNRFPALADRLQKSSAFTASSTSNGERWAVSREPAALKSEPA